MASDETPYHPHDAVKAAINGTLVSGSAGAFLSAIQNSLARRNTSAMGIFTRSGSTIAVFTAMGGAYEFTRNASANLREKDDSFNAALGGLIAGGILGLRFGSMPAVLGYGALAAGVLAGFDFAGGSLRGWAKDPNVDDFDRKEHLRLNRRRPIEQTIAEMGEGRGIYGPGYEERRRERIKAKYGIDIPVESS